MQDVAKIIDKKSQEFANKIFEIIECSGNVVEAFSTHLK